MAGDENLNFVLNATDNVSPTALRIAASQEDIAAGATRAQASIDSASLSLVKQLQVAQGLRAGIRGVTSGMIELTGAGEEAAAVVAKVNAVAGVTIGTLQLYRSVTPAVQGLSAALGGLFTIETMRAVLQSPWKLPLVAGAVGAGLTVAGLAATGNLGGGGGTINNVSNQVIFEGQSSGGSRAMSRDILSNIGGVQ